MDVYFDSKPGSDIRFVSSSQLKALEEVGLKSQATYDADTLMEVVKKTSVQKTLKENLQHIVKRADFLRGRGCMFPRDPSSKKTRFLSSKK